MTGASRCYRSVAIDTNLPTGAKAERGNSATYLLFMACAARSHRVPARVGDAAGDRPERRAQPASGATYGGDLGQHALLAARSDQRGNFNKLEVAWRFKTDNLGPRPEFNLESTPLMVNGVVYSTAGTRRAVVALDARHRRDAVDAQRERRRARRQRRRASSRAAAWRTGPTAARSGSSTSRPATGWSRSTRRPACRSPSFGTERHRRSEAGRRSGDRSRSPARSGCTRRRSSPKNVVIVGAAHRPGGVPKSKTQREGLHPRLRRADRQAAVDLPHDSAARRVRQRHVGEGLVVVHRQHRRVGADVGRRRARAWSTCRSSCRPATTTAAIGPGNGLFGESLVARRSEDRQAQVALPARAPRHLGHGHPVRADPRRHHRQRPDDQGGRAADQAGVALRVRSRDRQAGLADRRAAGPKGDVPGEWYSPTQPFPTKPPAYDRQGVSIDDLIDFTPELRAEAVKLVSQLQDRADLHAAGRQQGRGPARRR